MVDRKAGLVYVVDDVPDDGDAVTWDSSLRQWAPRAGATAESLGLGKYVGVGYLGLPTFSDPTSGIWSDHGWRAIIYATGGGQDQVDEIVGVGDGTGATITRQALLSGPFFNTSEVWVSNESAGPGYTQVTVSTHIKGDGTECEVFIGIDTGEYGSGQLIATETHTQLWIKGVSAQTDPILDLKDSDSVSIFSIAPDGSVGGVAPNDGDVLAWDAGAGKIKWVTP